MVKHWETPEINKNSETDNVHREKTNLCDWRAETENWVRMCVC